MNRTLLYVTGVALVLGLQTGDVLAQERSPSPGQQGVSQGQPPLPGGAMTAQSFVQEVAKSNQKEIEISRMAATKATSSGVKKFAEQLVTDHSKSLDALRQYATKKGITLPTQIASTESIPPPAVTRTSPTGQPAKEPAPGQAGRDSIPSTQPGRTETSPGRTGSAPGAQSLDPQMKELSAKTGAEFDKVYVQMMVDNHKKGVSLFEQQDKAKLGDAELQAFIRDTLPVLRRHLTMATDLQKELSGEAKPAPGRSPAAK
jgi:putative membrane protein